MAPSAASAQAVAAVRQGLAEAEAALRALAAELQGQVVERPAPEVEAWVAAAKAAPRKAVRDRVELPTVGPAGTRAQVALRKEAREAIRTTPTRALPIPLMSPILAAAAAPLRAAASSALPAGCLSQLRSRP